jgi:sporulation protein YlmC with PRC-barrel domain
MAQPGRRLDAHLNLLDRQIVDVDGRMVAKVDDVEIQERPDGRFAVTALLVGPGVLGPRIGGVVGRCMTAVWSRLAHKDSTGPGRIEMAAVADIGSAITLSVRRENLGVAGFEAWMRAQVIEKIPGASHEPDE